MDCIIIQETIRQEVLRVVRLSTFPLIGIPNQAGCRKLVSAPAKFLLYRKLNEVLIWFVAVPGC